MRIGSIDIEMFAPCGMNCTVCYKHCHTRKIQKPCSGCMQENKSKPVHCRKCRIKDCVQLKEITYYYQCGDFPCRLIRNLERSYNSRYKESPVENSEIVKGNGVFYFISWKHTPLDTPARNVAALSHCTTRFARSTEKEHDKNED